MRRIACHKFLLPALLLLWPTLAQAHQEAGAATGFLSGLQHPVSGADHVLAMIAVGLWGAQLGLPALWLLPLAFPMVMALGGMLGLLGVSLPGVEIGIALSAVALGLLVSAEKHPAIWFATLLVGFFAIFHGYAHGTELPSGASGFSFSIGFVIGTGLLHGCGILLGLAHRWRVGQYAIRGAGAMIFLAGIFFFWRAVG